LHLETQSISRNDEKTPAVDSTRESEAFERLHRPYASMNWIRFNGSLRHNRQSRIVQQYLSPLPGPPW